MNIWNFTESQDYPGYANLGAMEDRDGTVYLTVCGTGSCRFERVAVSATALEELAVAILRHQAARRGELEARVQYFESMVTAIHGEAQRFVPNGNGYERTQVGDPEALIESQPGIADDNCGPILVDRIADAPVADLEAITERDTDAEDANQEH